MKQKSFILAPERLQRDSKPPLPKVFGTNLNRRSASGSLQSSRSARASPRVTPRATPLQSPAVEQPPAITKPATTPTEAHKSRVPSHTEPGKLKQQQKQPTQTKLENSAYEVTKVEIIQEVAKIKDDTIIEEPAKLEEDSQDNKIEEVILPASNTQSVTVAEEKKDKVSENKQPEMLETKNEEDLEEVCDMTGKNFWLLLLSLNKIVPATLC